MTTRSRRPTKKPRREHHAAASEFDDPDLWSDIFAEEDANSNDDVDHNESGDVMDKDEEEEEDTENHNKYTTAATLPIAATSGRNALGPASNTTTTMDTKNNHIMTTSMTKTTVETVLDANFDGEDNDEDNDETEAKDAAVVPPAAADNNHEEHPSVPVALSSLPQSCSTTIFNYAAVTPEEVRDILSLISKQSRKDCFHKGIVQKIVPTIDLKCRHAKDFPLPSGWESGLNSHGETYYYNDSTQVTSYTRPDNRETAKEIATRTMLQKLNNHSFLMGTNKGRNHYEHMKVTGVGGFGRIKFNEALTITKDLYFAGVVSLDLSSPSASDPQIVQCGKYGYVSFPTAILSMLPCLLETNLTNTIWDTSRTNAFPCSDCFEKLTWNGRRLCENPDAPTIPNIKNIQEIYMDDNVFVEPQLSTYDDISILWNMEKVSKKRWTLFSNLRSAKKLERLSIRNVRYQKEKRSNNTRLFPQRALIKFVQNTLPPNVRWLRSDLSTANIARLQLDYPQIEFVQN